MLPRATWKGHLKMGHVSCSVAMFAATTEGERISLRQMNRDTGNPVRQQMVDSRTGDVVEADQICRGYQMGEDLYVYVEDEQIDAIRIESTHTLEIEHFVRMSEIDQVYLDGPFYVAPDDRISDDAFVLIREAMERSGMAGVARTVLSRRERLLVLQPRGKGMLASTLRYPYEVRGDEEIFAAIQERATDRDLIDLALEVVGRKTRKFKPKRYEDRYEKALEALIRKLHDEQSDMREKRAAARGAKLEGGIADALRRSLDEVQGRRGKAKPKTKT